MNLLTIPLRNVRRKWLKSALLLGVFALAATSITALSLVSRAVGAGMEEKLTAFGANILIVPRSETLSVSYGGFSLGDLDFGTEMLVADEVDKAIDSIELRKNISVVAPKLIHAGRVEGAPAGVIGVRWEREKALKGYWAVDGSYPEKRNEVLAGSKLADRLGLRPGDSTTLDGRPVTISGVLMPTGSDDDSVLFAGLSLVGEMAGTPGRATFMEVAALCSGCPIEDIVGQLAKALPGTEVTAMQQVVKQRMYSIRFVERLAFGVSSVILLIACASVGLSMLSSVNERVREIGLLRSLGFSRQGVFTVFCFEALLIGLTAGLAGYLLGLGASSKILSLLDMGGTTSFSAAEFGLSALSAALVAALSSVPPALKAASVEPSKALVSL
ncbi:ABC transporter permease [Desulfovibrio oxyclinae]|uniref:ABC transporter permease n=1 Tax=Desulfovibrio oxyclinae TaxID=63560 RepID=UPI0003661E97|nr:FtsX-like permease family protein [Desulfovibrio oxyclinae]